jgi:hypothetical protein
MDEGSQLAAGCLFLAFFVLVFALSMAENGRSYVVKRLTCGCAAFSTKYAIRIRMI